MNNLICKICQKKSNGYFGLSSHLAKFHKISMQIYYNEFIRSSLNEGICYCGNNTIFSSIRYGYRKYCSNKCAQRSEEVKERIIKINQERYGGPSSSCSKTVREKGKLTCQKHFNCDFVSQSGIVKDKKIQTNRRNRNCDNPLKDLKIREKIKLTNQERYGGPSPYSSKIIREKGKTTCQKHFNSDNFSKSLEGKLFHRIFAIKITETQKLNNEPLMPRVGFKERPCLNELEPFTPNKKIIRNNHDYAYIIGRFPDGEVVGLPLFIQFNESHHFKDKDTMKIENDETIRTTLDLASNKDIGPRIVFNISEKDWKENKNQVIADFKLLISNL